MNESTLTRNQKKTYGPAPIDGWGEGALIKAEVRWDDEYWHNTFSITGEIYIPGRPDCESCGCLHEEIAKAFPQLASAIKWHLCASSGPLHYFANAIYLAGDRDCHGLLKGETRQIRNGKTGLLAWELVPINEPLPHYVDSETKPSGVVHYEYRPWNRIGEGKPRQLDAARSAAVWPDATDEELTAPGLRERLEVRLSGLLVEMRAAIESLGFVW